MSTILITGAGRGIGLEFARQYAADGWTVLATVRDPAKGAALAALGRQVEVHLLDVALHELRLFKSRAQAQAAIAAGHVQLNDAAVKPSHTVAAGDRLTIGGRTFEVLELPGRSVSKEAARALVREVGDS